MRGQFGAQEQTRAIAAARENLQQEIAGNVRLAHIDAKSKELLANMDANARMQELQVSGKTAERIAGMELDQQLQIAQWERDLKSRGMTVQEALAGANIEQQKVEGTLNTLATFTNALEPLRAAGFNEGAVMEIFRNMNIPIGHDFITAQWRSAEMERQMNELRAEMAERARTGQPLPTQQFEGVAAADFGQAPSMDFGVGGEAGFGGP
jgi:hypothetical protein